MTRKYIAENQTTYNQRSLDALLNQLDDLIKDKTQKEHVVKHIMPFRYLGI